jgi:hypothetical protein
MNARRISTIVSATLLGLALSAGGGGMTPSAGAATIPTGISGAPAPSGGTSGDEGKAPTSAEPKSDDQMPGKTAGSHPKRKHTKATGVSRHVQRHHRVGTAVHRQHRKASGTTGAAAPVSAPSGTAAAPMAG